MNISIVCCIAEIGGGINPVSQHEKEALIHLSFSQGIKSASQGLDIASFQPIGQLLAVEVRINLADIIQVE